MRIILNNKGLVFGDLLPIAFSLIFIGAVIAVGMYVNTQFQAQLPVGTFYNESITYTNLTPVAPVCTPIIGGVNRIMNDSHELLSANWTNDQWNINLTLRTKTASLVVGAASGWLTTYECGNSSSYRVVSNATVGLANLSSWLPIIAVVLAAGIVIVSVIGWVGGRREL